jgi:DNA helicase-2/ATP-dependent DNA helicase PcrA
LKHNFSSELNDRQLEAVEALEGPMLIFAGAGSGKTRVIAYRIVHLLSKGVPPERILAVTFTNKAANEMSERVRSLMKRRLPRLTICTFHSFGALFLRENFPQVGYRKDFSIFDAHDQISLLKEIARESGLGEGNLDIPATAQIFSAVKTGRSSWRSATRRLRPLFKAYEKSLRQCNAVDFDDLIMLPVEILSNHPEVRQGYHSRFRHLLVDEFQDTSAAQYRLLRLLVGPLENVCVVGDDDQSIYSWRGASVANIAQFERDFPTARVFTLEQNYRSTATILKAANSLIRLNRKRRPKELWTGRAPGDPIELFAAESEMEEAEFIAGRIRTLLIKDSLRFHDFGVLLRVNHLTRAIEEAFRGDGIPYVVSGGMSFFERQEVRDMLAYLKCMANPDDTASLLRVVNTPRRGLGRRLVETATDLGARTGCSLHAALVALASEPGRGLEERVRGALAEFIELVAEYRARLLTGKKMADTLRDLVAEIDYWGHLISENRDAKNTEVAKWKFANVESLIGSLADYESDPQVESPNLYNYLARISLASRDDIDPKDADGKVNLMTIHSAKGLEFPVVFIAAVERDIIPHARSVEEEGSDPEEERRLFYVVLTRARRRLLLSWCSSRRKMGKPTDSFPSPFLEDLPEECLAAAEEGMALSAENATRLFSEARRRIFGAE